MIRTLVFPPNGGADNPIRTGKIACHETIGRLLFAGAVAFLAGCTAGDGSGRSAAPGVDAGGDSACVPSTCALEGADCGELPDGCHGVLHCGSCPAGQTCGGQGPNRCGTGACFPATCQQLGVQCGLAHDGCANVIDCGECPSGAVCGLVQPGVCATDGGKPDGEVEDASPESGQDAAAPTCQDGIANQDETDVDCGGGACGPCNDGRKCRISFDCVSGWCDATSTGTCCKPGLSGCAVATTQVWRTPWPDPMGDYYRYAPAAIEENGVRTWFWCGNWASGVVTDHIVMRVDTWNGSGWTAGAEKVALAPGPPGAWDDRHVCDPEVVAGEFRYAAPGEIAPTIYRYALFYLGANDEAANGGVNQVGWALAESLEGPWVRVSTDAPLVTATAWWGAGQPSAISLDGKGKVLLFYTRGDEQGTRTVVRRGSLFDAHAPVLEAEVEVPVAGLERLDGSPDPDNHGGAVVYDAARDLLWLVRGAHPFPGTCPDFISEALQVASIPAPAIWTGAGRWTVHANITRSMAGAGRVFDGGFVRTPFGQALVPDAIAPVLSVAQECAGNDFATSLWTYRTHDASLYLP